MNALQKTLLMSCVLLLWAAPAIGDDDLNTQLMRATVKIGHEKSTAAGFVLTAPAGDKFILVTAAHVLEQTPADETTVHFRRWQSTGVYTREVLKLFIRKEGKPLWTRHPSEDVCAMWMVPPAGIDLSTVPVSLLASDASLVQHQVHPGDMPCCLGFPHRNESNDAGFPLLRAGALASFPLIPTATTRTFLLSANTFEGDSGGPVYLDRAGSAGQPAARLILGLISAQRFLDEEAKMVYGVTKIRHRLGLAIVVHASFIKETIDRLP